MTDQLSPVVRTRHLTVGYAGNSRRHDSRSRSGRRSGLACDRGQRLGKDGALEDPGRPAAPVSGEVERRCGIGTGGAIYVHSVPYLFAGSVRRNLTLAHPSADDVRAVVEAFGLSRLLEREATTLSHGEQRRLALARAVVGRPSLLLVDEPEGGLDDEAISAWRACAVRAVHAREPVLVVAAHRPLAFGASP